jgi:hypothetical protein
MCSKDALILPVAEFLFIWLRFLFSNPFVSLLVDKMKCFFFKIRSYDYCSSKEE